MWPRFCAMHFPRSCSSSEVQRTSNLGEDPYPLVCVVTPRISLLLQYSSIGHRHESRYNRVAGFGRFRTTGTLCTPRTQLGCLQCGVFHADRCQSCRTRLDDLLNLVASQRLHVRLHLDHSSRLKSLCECNVAICRTCIPRTRDSSSSCIDGTPLVPP